MSDDLDSLLIKFFDQTGMMLGTIPVLQANCVQNPL